VNAAAGGDTPVSLIIATFNRGPRIGRTLDSVRAQTRRPDEVVVVDDCSTDGTGEWVREHYPEVRVVRPAANLRTSGARNFGAAAASNELLVFLDHDDELLPPAVATLKKNLRDFPAARAAFADHAYVNHENGVRHDNHHAAQPGFHRLRGVPVLNHQGPARLYGRPLYYALLRGNLLQQPWAIYRRTFLDLGGFAEEVRWCEDWDLYLRVADRVPLVLSDELISVHHIEGDNLHLTPDQDPMYVRVLTRQLECQRRTDWRAWTVTRRRLAMFAKTAGDRARPAGLAQAWRNYLRSLTLWPFDHVVAGRTILWSLRIMVGRT
jgi:glycosyltransferase involved in cell wall biosynthesis